jgi:mono/diheme cytochrome c family protein
VDVYYLQTPAWSQNPDTSTWFAPESAASLINPHQATLEDIKAGKKIFEKVCWNCHGTDGKGNGPYSGRYKIEASGSDCSTKVQKQTDGAIFWKISNGRSDMSAYGELLSSKQRWLLVCYIRQFGNQQLIPSENEN